MTRADAAGSAGRRRRTGAARAWTLVAVCVATFMLLLDVTVVNVALPAIERDLGGSFRDLQWVVNAYALTLSASILTAGSLADRFGRRRVFCAGLVLFSAASALCALATGPLALELARALQGVGAGAMLATSLALLAAAFGPSERGPALAVWGATTGLAVAVGPLVGGALVQLAGWEWIFLVNLPVGALALVLAMRHVRESRDPQAGPIDVAGLATFSVALALGTCALLEGNRRGWGDPAIVILFTGAAVMLVAFVLLQVRGEHPMLDLALVRHPTTIGASAAAFAVGGSAFAVLLFLTLYLQNVLGLEPVQAGLRLMPLTVAGFLAAALTSRLAARVATRVTLTAGLVLVGCGLLLMAGLTASSTFGSLVAGLVVCGLGIGLVNPSVAGAALSVAGRQRMGVASGLNNTYRTLGIIVGVSVLGALFEHTVAARLGSGAAPGRGAALAQLVVSGDTHGAIAALPPSQRAAFAEAAQASFVAGLNTVLVTGGALALAGALASVLLVRRVAVQGA